MTANVKTNLGALLSLIMNLTGRVVLVKWSCHDKDTDRLWCIGVITKTSVIFALTLNDSCHKHPSYSCHHVMIMKVSCFLCTYASYAHPFK